MSNITSWNGGVPSKSTLTNYVHDAKELEFSLYTLQQTREKLAAKLASVRKEDPLGGVRGAGYEAELRAEKYLLPYKKVDSAEEQERIMEYRKENLHRYWGADMYGNINRKTLGIRGFLLMALIEGVCIGISALIFGIGSLSGSNLGSLVMFVGIVGGGIIGAIVSYKVKNSKNDNLDAEAIQQYRREIDQHNATVRRQNEEEERRYKAACAKAEVENPKIRERNEQKKIRYQNDCAAARAAHNRKIALMQTQLDQLDADIVQMKQQREKFYSANIVPVDYRTLGCVFFLDHSFRNDLVDTVRQGIDRYELSEYRNAVIQGLGSIAANLNNLTGLMQDLGQKLNSIQSQVSFMSNDLYNMAERQSQAQEEANRQILEETRLRRYATEELNRNAERIVKYCDTGRTY